MLTWENVHERKSFCVRTRGFMSRTQKKNIQC